jgi:hypothetical protein
MLGFVLAGFRSKKDRRPRALSVGFSCFLTQYGLPGAKIEWQDNPCGGLGTVSFDGCDCYFLMVVFCDTSIGQCRTM